MYTARLIQRRQTILSGTAKVGRRFLESPLEGAWCIYLRKKQTTSVPNDITGFLMKLTL